MKLKFALGLLILGALATIAIIAVTLRYDRVDVVKPNGDIVQALCTVSKESNCTSHQLTSYSLTREELTNKSGRYEEKFNTFNEVFNSYLEDESYLSRLSRLSHPTPFITNQDGTIQTREDLFTSYFNRNEGGVLFNNKALTFSNYLSDLSKSNGVQPVLIHDGTTVAYMDGTKIASVQPLSEAPDFVQDYLSDVDD